MNRKTTTTNDAMAMQTTEQPSNAAKGKRTSRERNSNHPNE